MNEAVLTEGIPALQDKWHDDCVIDKCFIHVHYVNDVDYCF